MPISTTAELMSAATFYPAPPIHLPTELLDELADLQGVAYAFRSMSFTEGGYIPAMTMIEVVGSLLTQVTVGGSILSHVDVSGGLVPAVVAEGALVTELVISD